MVRFFKESNVHNSVKRWMGLSCLLGALCLSFGCTHYQPTKNVWKDTKGLWAEYVSPPAYIDYDDKGELSEVGQAMVASMMGIDIELTKLERAMINADKTPTRGWMNDFFATFPWVDGFAGIKAGGTLLGNEPAPGKTPKELDFNRILYEDEKQNTRALRCDVEMSSTGPEVIVSTPLYDGVDYLGSVAVYFDMATLMSYSKAPDDVVIVSPYGPLWVGRYDFGATPMAGIDWGEAAKKESSGTVTNETGSFSYQIRYLGNLPIIFAVVESGSFPAGAPNQEQTQKFVVQREKVAPPPAPERSKREDESSSVLGGAGVEEAEGGLPTDEEIEAEQARMAQMQRQQQEAAMQQQRAVRQRQAAQARARAQQRSLLLDEELEEAQPRSRPILSMPSPFGPKSPITSSDLPASGAADAATPEAATEAVPAETAPAEAAPATEETSVEPGATLPGGRPSPFGPRTQTAQPEPEPEPAPAPVRRTRPSPFGPRTSTSEQPAASAAPAAATAAPAAAETAAPSAAGTGAQEAATAPAESAGTAAQESAPAATEAPATLSGGRPSPFGPRN